MEKPIFIIGSGRCGSTIVHEMFTHHPRVAFLSGACQRWPGTPRYNRLAMKLIDVPLLARVVRRKLSPAEHWEFWDHHIRGFGAPFRDLRTTTCGPTKRSEF